MFYFQTDFGQVIDINHWILRPHGSWNCDLTSFYRCDHISKPSTIITAYRVISAGSVFSWLALFLSNRWLKCFWTCSERRRWFSQSAVGAFKKGLLRDVMGISGFSLRSHFFAPHRDTYVTTMARMTCVKNTLRIFRGYFNRKRVRRKNVWSVHVSNFAKCFLFIRYNI